MLQVKPRFALRGSSSNRLLLALPSGESGAFRASLEAVELPMRAELHAPNAIITHIYFPDRGVAASIIAPLGSDDGVEVGTVGNEGFVGLPSLFGVDTEPFRAVIQVGGNGWRTTTTHFRAGLDDSSALREMCLRFAQAFYVQVGQASACNRAHSVAERCARWLLMMHDRADESSFVLTQDYLAAMLGVRRAGVTVAAGGLQRAGLIHDHRAHITVIDRPGLEAAACNCYALIRDNYVATMEVGAQFGLPMAKTHK
jgi:CRP-like cAMP-binding protein